MYYNLSKLEIVYIKIIKFWIPGPGNCLVLPTGVDSHGLITVAIVSRFVISFKTITYGHYFRV